jgi:hypothetical protein
MFVDDGELFLTYSGNHWAATEYATGLARCSSALGPCTRVGNGPIIAADGVKGGPGGAATFRDHSDQLHIVYHAWNHPFSNYPQWPQCDTDNDGKCIDQGQRFMHVQVMCRMPNGAFHVGLPAGWSFCDAPPGTWFEHGVSWLADTGATTGVASYHFDPDGELTRAQAMTFLWRWAGEPAPTQPSPFTDVEPGTFYEQAVRWAAEIGLTTGTTATTFSPDQIIDRAQLATILHRVSGLIEPAGPSPFTDVLADTWYTDAVAWMVEAGVTTGLSNTEFGPQQTTTRAQFATFLCRYSRLDPAAPSAVPAVQACS